MKKILILAAAAATLASCSQNKYVVKGAFEGLAGTVYMFDAQGEVIDSTTVNNGAFAFKGTVDTVDVRYLADSRGDAPSTFSAALILEPGTITIEDSPENPGRKRAAGTVSNDASKSYGEQANALVNEFRSEGTTDERREAIEKEYLQLTHTTVDANRSNFFGAQLLAQQLSNELSGQELLDQIAKFPAELQQTQLLTDLKQNAESKLRTEVGQPYIDIIQNNADGQPVTLKSVVENPANKYTLVDFWASWCAPCMGEVPVLVKTYNEFHAKGFEIYGVSFDKERAKWLDAIAQHKLNWIHVSDLNGFDNQAAKDYAVRGIPSNFLIDAQGVIVAKNLRGEALYEKIKELFPAEE